MASASAMRRAYARRESIEALSESSADDGRVGDVAGDIFATLIADRSPTRLGETFANRMRRDLRGKRGFFKGHRRHVQLRR